MTHIVISHWNYDHRCHTSLWHEVISQVIVSTAYCQWDNICTLTWTDGGAKLIHHSSSWEQEGNLEKAKLWVVLLKVCSLGACSFTGKYLFTSRRLSGRRQFSLSLRHILRWVTETLNCIEEVGVSLGQVDVQLPVVVRPLHVLPLYQTLK